MKSCMNAPFIIQHVVSLCYPNPSSLSHAKRCPPIYSTPSPPTTHPHCPSPPSPMPLTHAPHPRPSPIPLTHSPHPFPSPMPLNPCPSPMPLQVSDYMCSSNKQVYALQKIGSTIRTAKLDGRDRSRMDQTLSDLCDDVVSLIDSLIVSPLFSPSPTLSAGPTLSCVSSSPSLLSLASRDGCPSRRAATPSPTTP